MQYRELIISNYIKAYNSFDVGGMLKDLAPTVKFENVSNGEVNMTLEGIDALREQAQQATKLFQTREQTIKSLTHNGDETEIEIGYHAILAIDLPNGLKKGDELNLAGKSVFTFEGDIIVGIRDIS